MTINKHTAFHSRVIAMSALPRCHRMFQKCSGWWERILHGQSLITFIIFEKETSENVQAQFSWVHVWKQLHRRLKHPTFELKVGRWVLKRVTCRKPPLDPNLGQVYLCINQLYADLLIISYLFSPNSCTAALCKDKLKHWRIQEVWPDKLPLLNRRNGSVKNDEPVCISPGLISTTVVWAKFNIKGHLTGTLHYMILKNSNNLTMTFIASKF